MLETKEDLPKQLKVFSEYCKYWQLKVNVEKSKIFVFSRGPEARLANPFQKLLVGRAPHNICKCIKFFSNFRIS
jgi:hypothetical protein